ncbi:DegT/DnrJ/EryC1/StrS family aminotransferase [Paenibacillus sp. DMB20]|uniref:DegT/DnrJ/EryC1/StrS family aminotransferase n=1 Tax=Paenibacillus sp. DMB20 TaxID=1642570 RepID=UPI002E15BE8C
MPPFLLAQLESAESIIRNRLDSWNVYMDKLKPLVQKGLIEVPSLMSTCTHNAHVFYIKVQDLDTRTKLLKFLKDHHVMAVFHYVPLHSSKAGEQYGRFNGEDVFTTKESERLIRLPLYYGIKDSEMAHIIDCLYTFFAHFDESK